MSQKRLALIAILVPEYDAGIAFFVETLGFTLLQDTPLSETRRWVRVGTPGQGTEFLIARAVDDQRGAIGNQGGGRVWLFLETDDFATMPANGVHFETAPRDAPYGTIADFHDPFGNRWDLIQFAQTDRAHQ